MPDARDTECAVAVCGPPASGTPIAAVYLGAALDPSLRPYAIAATILAGAMAVLSLVVVVWKRQSHYEMPQWMAFLVLALSGLWALS
ncbi:hypothetical protein [Paracoccus sp. (in: a-proteobacteria)]|uniref:hypothetical protein n=1 Tax=Paracoccus sp. TaxID=267 RepID=UPI002AFE8FAE|nr:hypothetical protein [Paracoccus sp. (in: a-proteobacteria)]